MTELVMAISNSLKGMRKGGTVGKPFPGVEAMILTEDGGSDDTTAVGELCIKSPSLFKEYWKLPQVTKESFIDSGFFKTGDAARVDEDGYYIILGRNNADIMKVGGYKFSALEIEATILEDYTEMSLAYRPSHAYATYDFKYGLRSVQGGGRSSARETIGRVAAGALAKKILKLFPGTELHCLSTCYEIPRSIKDMDCTFPSKFP